MSENVFLTQDCVHSAEKLFWFMFKMLAFTFCATYASLPFSFYSTTLTLKSLDLIALLEFTLFFPFPPLHWPSSQNSFKKTLCASLKSALSRKGKPSLSKISNSLVTNTIKRSSFYISGENKSLSLKYKVFRIEFLNFYRTQVWSV